MKKLSKMGWQFWVALLIVVISFIAMVYGFLHDPIILELS